MPLQFYITYVSPYAYGSEILLNALFCTRTCVVDALWNALRGQHKHGAMNGNQYAARRSMITRLTRNSLTRVRVRA